MKATSECNMTDFNFLYIIHAYMEGCQNTRILNFHTKLVLKNDIRYLFQYHGKKKKKSLAHKI